MMKFSQTRRSKKQINKEKTFILIQRGALN